MKNASSCTASRGIFSASATLSHLYEQAELQYQMLLFLHRVLPFPQTAISACFVDGRTLTLFCPNGSWATRLKCQSERILDIVHANVPAAPPLAVDLKIVEVRLSCR